MIDLLRSKVGTKYQIEKGKMILGKRLEKGEESSTGLYGIVSSITDKPLRVALNKDIANMLAGDQYRYITEAYLLQK